ncbi:hypothetical protein GCM10010251_50860 [Streptomyces aurantiogriseus]|uniref:Uncharacterized protein n=1 Tax=Streptomyces aurantiogriseus TaxID=66870 RepID=A0A918CJZ7_9ACTN|nr:hypothetical protein GCM10010251_50860 [Streptomyces aurantiogriseus]
MTQPHWIGFSRPQSAGQSCQSIPAFAARSAAIAAPRISRSCPDRLLVALAVGAATAPASRVAATSTPAEPNAAVRLFGRMSLKWGPPRT